MWPAQRRFQANPLIKVADIESGKVVLTRKMFGG